MPDFSVDYIGKDAVNLSNPIQSEPTERDIEDMQRILVAVAKRPTLVPEGFWAQLIDQIQVSNLQIPVSQLLGFTQFNASRAFIATNETRSSTTYGDCATVGPEITGLPPGVYIALVSAYMGNSGAVTPAYMSSSANGATASDNDAAIVQVNTAGDRSVSVGIAAHTLTQDTNTITAKYRVGSAIATGSYSNRNLVVIRSQNL